MDIIQTLEQHEEALRSKKLIFCLCKKYWENDSTILSSFSLADLVQELVQSKPTIEQLTFAMYKLVKTLNRPKVYANVAKMILDEVTPLYQDSSHETAYVNAYDAEEIESNGVVAESKETIDLVVKTLNSHVEESRIKKLIFAVCKNRWENNLQVIENYGFKDLVLETCQVYPTRTKLQIALTKIIKNINKQTLYLAVAHIILNEFSPLYDSSLKHLERKPASRNEAQEQSDNTQIVPIRSIPMATSVPPRSPVPRSQDYETSIIDLSEQMVTELRGIQATSQPTSSKTYDLFEVRQTIMQYTNPLRAKILMFSVLFHPWDRSGQDWSMLRSYTIDDLVEQLIVSGKCFTELDERLQSTAKSLSEAEAQLQTASTISEAIKPFV
jgi:hypothetical protein